MSYSEVIDIIKSLGFPVVMCLWFMIRTEKIMKENTKAVKELSTNISILKLK